MRKGEFALRRGEIRVKFHAPVDARHYSLDQKEELMAQVHAAVAAGLPDEQKPALPGAPVAASGGEVRPARPVAEEAPEI